MVGELGVMAHRLQCNVLIILPPGVQRFGEGQRDGRMNEEALDGTVKCALSSGSSFHFLFPNILKFSHTPLHQLRPPPFIFCSAQSLLMIRSETALLGGSRPENSGIGLTGIFIRKKCGKEGSVDLRHFKSPTPGALQPHTVRLTFVAETESCLTREFLKGLPRDVVVELSVVGMHVCVHICVPVYMSM